MGHCDFCGASGPVTDVHYRQNTGMLVMRQSKEWVGNACKPCGSKWFWKSTLHNIFLGWWGTISLIVTPFFILGNIASFVKVIGLPKAETKVLGPAYLHTQRDYALNLLDTKPRAEVIDQLTRSCGASRADVDAFVAELEAPVAASA